MNGDFSRFGSEHTETKNQKATSFTHMPLGAKEKDRFSQAFNVLVNYWEIKPSQYETKLHELALKDVRQVSAFIPWAHAETDIYHSLKKFVRAAWSVKLNVRLFVMPELGVNYPNAGFPKDLLGNTANLAVDRIGRVIYNYAAPNIFPLPSFSSPDVLKRFGNYLIKVGSILGEIFQEVGTSDFCEVVVSNSLFNYYRTHGLSLAEHGDYSAANVMAFRDFLDREYRSSSGGSDGEEFKMQLYESHNRHRFFTHVEKLLREKTDMVFVRKKTPCEVRHLDLFNPECDPDAAYQGLLSELFDFRPSVQRFYEAIVAGGYRNESIYLGNSGTLRRFLDQEKSFLILAALIHSGEVGVMAEDLFKLSTNFQRKLRGLTSFLEDRKMQRQSKVVYVSASKFSMEETSFNKLTAMAPGVLTVLPGLSSQSRQLSERLIFMDPKSVIRAVELVQLLAAAQTGKVVAVPLPMTAVANFTTEALSHFEKFKKGRQALKLNIGVGYQVYEYHLGHVVFYDPHVFWSDSEEDRKEVSRFFQAILGLAEVKALCAVNDPRLHISHYASSEDSTQKILFLINPTNEQIDCTLSFSDLVSLAALPQGGPNSIEEAVPILGRSFELSVPALGVLSMQLAEPSQTEIDRSVRNESKTSGEAEDGVVQWT